MEILNDTVSDAHVNVYIPESCDICKTEASVPIGSKRIKGRSSSDMSSEEIV